MTTPADPTSREPTPQIVMITGVGNNENAWARILSRYARVVLIQRSNLAHEEIWLDGELQERTPQRRIQTTNLANIWFRDPIIVFQLAALVRRLTRGYNRGKIDIVIGASNYSGMTGLWLQRLGHARTVVSFIQDYFPIRGTLPQRIWRSFHAGSSRFVVRRAAETWCVSPRNPTAKIHPKHHIIPIYIDPHPVSNDPRREIAYIGAPSPEHGLEVLFEICTRHDLTLNVIGDSPYLPKIRHLAPAGTRFHGFINDSDQISAILRSCFCGYAVYMNPSRDSHSYYGVPSKLFNYLANGVPVITTDTAAFSARVEEEQIGKLVEPTPDAIEAAVLEIQSREAELTENVLRFRTRWNADCETFLRERATALLRG